MNRGNIFHQKGFMTLFSTIPCIRSGEEHRQTGSFSVYTMQRRLCCCCTSPSVCMQNTQERAEMSGSQSHMQVHREKEREREDKTERQTERERGSPPPSQWVLSTQSVWELESQRRHWKRWSFQNKEKCTTTGKKRCGSRTNTRPAWAQSSERSEKEEESRTARLQVTSRKTTWRVTDSQERKTAPLKENVTHQH